MKKFGIFAMILLMVISSLMFVGCGDKEFNPSSIDVEDDSAQLPGDEVSSESMSISFELFSVSMVVDDEKIVKVVISPADEQIEYSVSSDNTYVATVFKTTGGVKIIAKSKGSTTIRLSSVYGSDTLSVDVGAKVVTLNKTNCAAYINSSATYSSSSVTVWLSQVNYKHKLDYTATVNVFLTVRYSYYPNNSIYGSPNTGFGYVSKNVFMNDSKTTETVDMLSEIKLNCPGAIMMSYSISAAIASISTIIGTAEIWLKK